MISTGKVGGYFDTNFYFKQAYVHWDYASVPVYWSVFTVTDTPIKTRHTTHYYTSQPESVTICSAIIVEKFITEDLFRSNQMYLEIKVNVSSLPPVLKKGHIQYIEYNDITINANQPLTDDLNLKYIVPLSTVADKLSIVQNEYLSGQLRHCVVETKPTLTFVNKVTIPTSAGYLTWRGKSTTLLLSQKWQVTLGTAHTQYKVGTLTSNFVRHTTNSILVYTESLWLHNIRKKLTTFSTTYSQLTTRVVGRIITTFVTSTTT